MVYATEVRHISGSDEGGMVSCKREDGGSRAEVSMQKLWLRPRMVLTTNKQRKYCYEGLEVTVQLASLAAEDLVE
jgi:hypothetical protein